MNTITVPEGLGKYYTYMNWNAVTNTTSNQYRLRETASAKGEVSYTSDGYAMINGRYVVALTDTFGNVGDYVNIKTKDGTVINGIIGDIKSQTKTWYDQNPANKWGHNDGQVVVEFVTNWGSGHENPKSNGGVVSITNLGNYETGFIPDDLNTNNIFTSDTEDLKTKIFSTVVKFIILIGIGICGAYYFLKAFDIDLKGVLL